jgi:hypothetical protein
MNRKGKATTVARKTIYNIINHVATAQADYNRVMLNLTAVLLGAYARHHNQSWTKSPRTASHIKGLRLRLKPNETSWTPLSQVLPTALSP